MMQYSVTDTSQLDSSVSDLEEKSSDVEHTGHSINGAGVAGFKAGRVADAASVIRRNVVDAIEARVGAIRSDLIQHLGTAQRTVVKAAPAFTAPSTTPTPCPTPETQASHGRRCVGVHII